MSKPSLRLQLTKLLVFYHILLWQFGHWPQSKFHCRADLLPDDEVNALSVFMSTLELRPEQIIKETYCSDVVWTYGFIIECHCANVNECRITGIRMSYLGLTGTIHESVGNLKSLTYLILSNNKLHGGIPDTFGKLKNLQVLDLSQNQLNGSIPASLGSMVSLRWLYLQYNLLSGDIPRSFGSLANLTELDLSENQLSGPLPESLGKLKNLTILYVSANYLSGKFPETYGNLKSLKKFSIAGNYISGPLPVETIANWTTITQLLISDLANNSFQLPLKIANSTNFISLTLRNCSITGPIPKYIGEEMTSLRYLDLSFNKLTGGLPQNMSSNMTDMSFSGNMLDGTIPPWIHGYFGFQTRMNLFACCRNSSTNEPVMMENRYCPENNPKYHSLFINCGGGETTVRGNKYDQDNDTSLSYTSPKKNWAYSVSGGYGVPESNTSNYIKSMTCGVPITEAPLYEKARLSPVSLKYYAFCLRKGNYTVTLYFNEVVYTKNEDYTSLRKRVFDVYIQDVRRLNYVKIREKKGSEPITENISAVVVNDSGLLNIHFYWPGKGSYQYQPSFSGPLISAISVTPEFSSDKNNGQLVALITLASIVAALPLSLAFAWKMGWLSSEEFRNLFYCVIVPASQDLNPIGNVQQDYKQQAPNQSQFAIVEEGYTEQQAPNQSQFTIVEEGNTKQQAANQSQFAIVEEGNIKQQAANRSQFATVEEGDTEQQAANQSQSAVVEEGDTEKYGNKERQQQPQSVGRGRGSNKGLAVAANQSKSAVVEEGDTEKNGNKERQQQPQSVRRGKSSDKGSAVAANQSKYAIVEEGDTEKYGNKERQQQPQSVRRGKSSDKGSVLLGGKIIDEVCPPAKPTDDINVVGSLEESAGISDMAESFSPL
ncbi:hypothetical protein C1H46_011867 [Malus baccata]|uniref:non-specific serine/threonine protein kinase n=1 Tax=Malus baccata TaxID=106549 RepID=A0A540MUJ4_MALBA|nr:hypothetical protein C1H46_011867 [Malus baccata]